MTKRRPNSGRSAAASVMSPRIAQLLLTAALFAALASGCTPDRNKLVEVSIPPQSSSNLAVRVSIQRLSEELRHRPDSKRFMVHWRVNSNGLEVARCATTFHRDSKTIGYELDPYSGYSGMWTNVDDAAVHTVAGKSGTFGDFGEMSWPSQR